MKNAGAINRRSILPWYSHLQTVNDADLSENLGPNFRALFPVQLTLGILHRNPAQSPLSMDELLW